jgi:catechol 2,3-dioxygenase-like lactoylglutathione lyase family enzyme
MAESNERPAEPALEIAGLHHAAYIADHLAETHRFWTETIGLRFSWAITNLHVPSTGLYSPHIHVFYELAERGNVAFFAIQEGTLDPGPNWQDHPARHYALQAASADDLPAWKARLEAAGVAVSEEADDEGRPVLAFRDPEGLLWKISPPVRTYTAEDRVRAQALVEQWIAAQRAGAGAEAGREERAAERPERRTAQPAAVGEKG